MNLIAPGAQTIIIGDPEIPFAAEPKNFILVFKLRRKPSWLSRVYPHLLVDYSPRNPRANL